MKENMTVSGTHDNDEPWNFVECAMVKILGFTNIAVYYTQYLVRNIRISDVCSGRYCAWVLTVHR